jgi:hypothetical protein
MRLTVGPLPPSVYWRRRAIVLAGALLVLFLVAQACMAATASPDGGASGNGTPPPASSPPAGPPLGPANAGMPAEPPTDTEDQPPAPPAVTGDACEDGEMVITAEAERTGFAAGEPVRFTIRIQNSSGRSCVRDIGGDLRELYLIRGTGANKVWSTQHCGGPTGSDERELPPGFETTYFIVFDGRASTTCDSDEEPAGPQVAAGDYQLFARLGTVYSEPLRITIS